MGIILARLEKLEQASNHPDLGPVGDGLITLMDQKLSKLDDRLYELSSKVTSSQGRYTRKETRGKARIKGNPTKAFNFEKPKESKMEPIEIPPTKSRQSFELTTLTNVSRREPKFPLFEEAKQVVKPMPQPRVMKTELVKPKEEIVTRNHPDKAKS